MCCILNKRCETGKQNHREQDLGLSPNGKATDSDSVIFKVRILVAQLKHFYKKCLTKFVILCIMIFAAADAAKNNGLSPNGKATDSDSVIFKVRILVAQLRSIWRLYIIK